MRRLFLVGLLAVFAACGGKEDRPDPVPPGTGQGGGSTVGTSGGNAGSAGKATGGSGATSGNGGAGNEAGSAGEAGAGGADDQAPIVEITSPMAVAHPDEGEVLVADQVIVLCKASRADSPGSLPPSTVTITLEDADVIDDVVAERTNNQDEYRATFPLATRQSGQVRLSCRADDAAGRSGRHEISTFVDRGPTIEPILPPPGAYRPLAGEVVFEFSVAPTPLAPGDEGAEVVDVALTVEGVPIEYQPARGKPGVYTASVAFKDKVLFPQTPTGNIAVTIEATNAREPRAAIGVLNYDFTLDADAPVVTIVAPPKDRVLPGTLQVIFTAVDAISGVDLRRVQVAVNGEIFDYDEADPTTWKHEGNTFTFNMDRSKIETQSQAHIVVSATDEVGNGPATDTRDVHLDAVPPFVSLDVPNLRVVQPQANGEINCSSSFDPLGEAVNDLTLVSYGGTLKPWVRFRAFMSDRTTMDGQDEYFFAGVVNTSGSIYVQPASAPALLVDQNDDGVCDGISVEAQMNIVGTVSLDPLAIAGEYVYDPTNYTDAPDVSNVDCVSRATNNQRLCANQASDIEVVVRQLYQNQAENFTAMWGVNVGMGITCTGSQTDLTTLVGNGYEGWVCAAASAVDDVGNLGLSAPLRICLDNGTGAAAPCRSLANPPSCTDGCAPPSRSPEGDDGNGEPLPFLWQYMVP